MSTTCDLETSCEDKATVLLFVSFCQEKRPSRIRKELPPEEESPGLGRARSQEDRDALAGRFPSPPRWHGKACRRAQGPSALPALPLVLPEFQTACVLSAPTKLCQWRCGSLLPEGCPCSPETYRLSPNSCQRNTGAHFSHPPHLHPENLCSGTADFASHPRQFLCRSSFRNNHYKVDSYSAPPTSLCYLQLVHKYQNIHVKIFLP